MTDTGEPGEEAELSRLERFGVRWLRRPLRVRSTRAQRGAEEQVADDVLYTLSEREQQALQRVERAAIFRAALAGALSAGASVWAAWWAGDPSALGENEGSWMEYWAWVGGVTAVASLLELAYLYHDGVRSVARMAHAAGLPLEREEVDSAITVGLARAALEVPTPPRSRSGVHAHQESNRWVLLLLSVFYKLKVTVTSFLLKALLRRALGRAAARMALEVVAIPVTAVWNAVVAYRVLKEARLRIVGARAAPLIVEFIGGGPEHAELILRSVASVVVRAGRAHPNTEGILGSVLTLDPQIGRGPQLGDSRELKRRLPELPREEVGVALRAAVVATVMDGALSWRERRYLKELFELAEVPLDLPRLRAFCVSLRQGAGLSAEALASLDPFRAR